MNGMPQGIMPPYGSMPMAPKYVPKTALNELESFLSGLTPSEREAILTAPEYIARLSDFMHKFLFWLLQGEQGAAYISSSDHRQEMAEKLKLTAHALYNQYREESAKTVASLEEQNAALLKELEQLKQAKKETKVNGTK